MHETTNQNMHRHRSQFIYMLRYGLELIDVWRVMLEHCFKHVVSNSIINPYCVFIIDCAFLQVFEGHV